MSCPYDSRSVASGGGDTNRLYGFGQSAAHRPENGGGHFSFRSQRNAGGPLGKFRAAVQPHAGLAQKLRGETHVFGALDSPEPQLVFLALQKVQRFLELLHGAVERRSQEVHVERPGMPRVMHAQPDAILARLVALHTAAIFIARGANSGRHRSFTDPSGHFQQVVFSGHFSSQGPDWGRMTLKAVQEFQCGRKDLSSENTKVKTKLAWKHLIA